MRALRWGAIDFETGRAKIDEACKGEDGIGLPKWGKVREIVIPRLALERLLTWHGALPFQPADEHFVFGFLDRRPLGYEGAHNVFETIVEEAREAGILPSEDERWITPHAARHGLNTNLLASGLSPLIV
jgi:integrase